MGWEVHPSFAKICISSVISYYHKISHGLLPCGRQSVHREVGDRSAKNVAYPTLRKSLNDDAGSQENMRQEETTLYRWDESHPPFHRVHSHIPALGPHQAPASPLTTTLPTPTSLYATSARFPSTFSKRKYFTTYISPQSRRI